MIRRDRALAEVEKRISASPVTAIIGPRRCGKTTLAKQLASTAFFNVADPTCARELQDPAETLSGFRGLVVIDEIHYMPELFPVIKTLVDENPSRRFVILGSASLTVTTDSRRQLAGRMSVYELGSFTLSEVGYAQRDRHWFRGGFPESYLATSEEQSVLWRRSYLENYFKFDIRELRHALSPHIFRTFWQVMGTRQGQRLNSSTIAQQLGISVSTVKNYIEVLQKTSTIRLLYSGQGGIKRAVTRVPKVYVRDSGLAAAFLGISSVDALLGHDKAPALWEAYVVQSVIEELGAAEEDFCFLHLPSGQEVDLAWGTTGQRFGVEAQYRTEPRVPRSMERVVEEAGLQHLWIFYRGEKELDLDKSITALPVAGLQSFADRVSSYFSVRVSKPSSQVRPSRTVFVSYSHKDDAFVQKLQLSLEAAAIGVTIDTQTLRFGDVIKDFISESVRHTQYTVQVISQNSLRSSWVMIEFLEVRMQEDVQRAKKYIPIAIDNYLFQDEAYLEIDKDVQEQIDRLNEYIAVAHTRNQYTTMYDRKRERLLDLKNNLAKAIDRLRESLVGDFSDDKCFDANLPKLVAAIREDLIS
jgi:predicted AAA+ superfamily ATPase